ncbi:MAG: Ig-like domain-containing protein, partial [Clostridia bacterium]|nr:Ig-like domain-containing protein [Clostridia bacterium]
MTTRSTLKTPPLKPLWLKLGTIAFAVLLVVVAIVLVVENVKGGAESAKTGKQVAGVVADVFNVDTSEAVFPTVIHLAPEGEPQLGVPYNMNAVVIPVDTTDKSIRWSSSNKAIATVEDGWVTFHQYGKVKISAISGMSSEIHTSKYIECVASSVDFWVDMPASVPQFSIVQPACYPIVDGQPDLSDPRNFAWCEWEVDEEYFYNSASYGLVARKAGTTTVRGTAGDYTHEYEITIEEVPYVAPTGFVTNVDHNGASQSPDNLGYLNTYMIQAWPLEGEHLFATYSVADPSVATVDENGHVNCVGLGSTEVSVASVFDDSVHYVIPITVKEKPPETISVVGPAKAGTEKTASYHINTTGSYTTGGARVTWSSSNPKIAKIDQDGKLTVHHIGKVTITATSGVDPTIYGSLTVQCRLFANFVQWVRKILGHFLGNAAL